MPPRELLRSATHRDTERAYKSNFNLLHRVLISKKSVVSLGHQSKGIIIFFILSVKYIFILNPYSTAGVEWAQRLFLIKSPTTCIQKNM